MENILVYAIVIMWGAFIAYNCLSYYFSKQNWQNNPKYKHWLKGYTPLSYRQLTALHEIGMKL